MNHERVNTWRMACNLATVIALGAVAAAQSNGSQDDVQAKRGHALTEVSLGNDIRTPPPLQTRGGTVLEEPAEPRRLELFFRLSPRADADMRALMPSLDEMEKTLILANGTPGGVAVIHLDTSPEVRRSGGIQIVGLFDEDGEFQVQVPTGFEALGVFARGEEITSLALQGKAREVPESMRPMTDPMNVEVAITTASGMSARFFADVFTKLEFRTGGQGHARRSGPDVDGDVASGGVVGDSGAAGDGEVFVELPNPEGGMRAHDKIPLQRPPENGAQRDSLTIWGLQKKSREVPESMRPVPDGEDVDAVVFVIPGQTPRFFVEIFTNLEFRTGGFGHARPASGVEDDPTGAEGAFIDPPDPEGGMRAHDKNPLQRPPANGEDGLTHRDDHVLKSEL